MVLDAVSTPQTPDTQVAKLKIGQVGERVGLSLRTVRYYEEVGLLTPSGRTAGGFRLYSEEAVARLRFLKGMKPLGLSLEEIRELVELLEHSENDENLDGTEQEHIRQGLERYVERAHARISQLEGHIAEVARVRDHVGERLEQLDAGAPD
jgi:MerR family copper efflux transcriptional regulator